MTTSIADQFDLEDEVLDDDKTPEVIQPLIPYDFQEADIRKLGEHNYSGFVVAETGAGKTLIGIETALRSKAKIKLIIAIAPTIEHVWRDGILRQDPTANVRVLSGKPDGQDALFELQLGFPGWYIVTPQQFTRWDWSKIRVGLALVDEAHLLSNRGTVGQKKLLNLKATCRIVMSGTIFRNKIENFWSLIRWVYHNLNGPNQIGDISPNRWIKNYMATVYDRFKVGNIRIIGELEPGRIAREIPCYIQHFKREECCEFHPNGFLWDLPAPIEIIHSVELTPKQRKAIESMQDRYVAYLEDQYKERKALIVKLPMVAQIRLRQMTLGLPSFDENDEIWFEPNCESPKLDHFKTRLEATGDEPYLFLTSSEKFATEATRRINEEWGITAAKWAGTVKSSVRDQTKNDFIEGKIRVVVGVTEAVSTGIDGLQHAASRLYWADRSRDLTVNIQTEGRLDRRGQRSQVVNEEVVAEGSMDRGIIGAQLDKRLQIARSMKRELMKAERKKKLAHI